LPDGPADRKESTLLPRDILLSIDGQKVDPEMDLTLVLNGLSERDIALIVQRTSEADKPPVEVSVNIRPISYSRARALLYDHWLDHNRKLVEKMSDGKLGYLHIRSMDLSSFYEFERQLYNVGYGRSGLVIDVRDNGGGSTTDHLLTALTQPRHAITVPRGGMEGYPQDRKVYASWSKPIVVLCNQNSYSNAEIFSHAIRTLGRGKLVGVQTAGGVVSTGVARITDVGVLRAPNRGWFLIQTGQDMELNGALPDIVIWPKPGELPQGIDKQLEQAVKSLQEEVAKVKADPKPIYRSEERKASSHRDKPGT
jgi:tricorn protease